MMPEGEKSCWVLKRSVDIKINYGVFIKQTKQVNLRFHSKVEFFRTFFGGNIGLKKSF